MCLALPGGQRNAPPASLLHRIAQGLGFGVLVSRLFLTGLWQWLVQRATANR